MTEERWKNLDIWKLADSLAYNQIQRGRVYTLDRDITGPDGRADDWGISQGAGLKLTHFRSKAFRRFFCYVRFFKLFKITHIKRICSAYFGGQYSTCFYPSSKGDG